jgi:hypothetical protein
MTKASELTMKTKRIACALAVAVALTACGDDDGTKNSATTNNPTTNQTTNSQTVTEVRSLRGWLQAAPDAVEGPFIESDSAVLPDSCGGDLAAASDSDGLVLLSWPTSGNSGFEPAYDANQLEPRPDHAEVSPIFTVFWSGELRSGDAVENDDYPREGTAEDQNLGGLVNVDVCGTAYTGGTCWLPSAEFPFEGCYALQSDSTDFIIGAPELVQETDSITLSYRINDTCDTETDAADFPADAERGLQTITLAADLPENTVVELTADDVAWDSTYLKQLACEEIGNLGTVCECEWNANSTFELERAWALKQNGKVYLEVKAEGDDGAMWIWGGFEILPSGT